MLIPASKLNKLFQEGYATSYEIAEELGVTEELLEKAYKYYNQNQLIKA